MYLSGNNMFQRVCIDCCRSNGGGPLVVYFVNVLVYEAVVEQAVPVVEPDIMTDDTH